jgi:hypothetical protein
MNAIVQSQRQASSRSAWGWELLTGQAAAGGVRPLLYMLLSLVPSATLMCGWMRYQHAPAWFGVPTEGVIAMAVALWLAELTGVPLLVRFAHSLGGAPAAATAHHRVEFLEAFAPPVLMLTPLALVVAALFAYAVAAAFVATTMILFIGRYADRDAAAPGFSGLSWLVVELGFAGWALAALLVSIA